MASSDLESILADLRAAGLEPPPASPEPAPPQFSGFQNFLGGLSGLEQPTVRPHGFGGNFFAGLNSGLGAAGTRVQQSKAQFEHDAAMRRAAADAERLASTKTYREAVFNSLQDARKTQAKTTDELAKYQRDNPQPGSAEYRAMLQTAKDKSAAEAAGKAMAPATKDESAVQLSPGGLDAAALMYSKTGQLPPMGIGKATAGVRTKIINRAAELDPNLDIASNKAGFESNRAALTNLRKIHGAAKAFEGTALKNATVLEGTLTTLANSGSPWLNRPIRMLQSQGLGDPSVAKFNAALRTVAPEFAKLLSSPTGSGQLSDSARKEIEMILSPDATPGQIMASLSILRQDAHNRTTSYEDQIRSLEDAIAHPARGSASSRIAATHRYDPATGTVTPIGP